MYKLILISATSPVRMCIDFKSNPYNLGSPFFDFNETPPKVNIDLYRIYQKIAMFL